MVTLYLWSYRPTKLLLVSNSNIFWNRGIVLVHKFGLTIHLRVLQCGFLVVDLEKNCHVFNCFIQKMFSFIIYKDLGITKLTNDIFIQKCGCCFNILNLDYFGFCPFCEIFGGYDDVFHSSR